MVIGELGVYLLKVSMLLVFLYVFNKLLLSRETFHRFNRFVWIAIVVGSFAVPLLPSLTLFDVEKSAFYGSVTVGLESMAVVVADEGVSLVEWIVNVAFWIYVIGIVALVAHRLMIYCSLLRLVLDRRYDRCRVDGEFAALVGRYQQEMGVGSKIRYVVHDRDLAPFSWLNFVVMSQSDLESNVREIVLHELAHVKQRHTWDVLLMDLVTIVLWFNPAAWLMKRELQQVHEYCADDAVLYAGVNIKEYQLLLIKKAVGARLYSISNSLNHSNLKNRITMMLQKKSSRMATAKALYAIPLVAIAMVAFSSPALADSTSEISRVKITNYLENDQTLAPQKAEEKQSEVIYVGRIDDPNTHIFVNGEKITGGLNRIDADKIKKVEVVKGRDTYKEYHVEGGTKSNLIIITLKDGETLESAMTEDAANREVYVGNGISVVDIENDKVEPVAVCEQMPLFNGGGIQEFRQYVVENLKYPENAVAKKIEETVLVQFVINVDGSVSDVKPLKDPTPELYEAVASVIKASPKWTPGVQDGRKVRVSYCMPVEFKL